jgi:hypothetical protein
MIELYICNIGCDLIKAKLERGKIEKDDSELMCLLKEKYQPRIVN